MENPNKDAFELSAWKWMMKYHKKEIIFLTMLGLVFIVVPLFSEGPLKLISIIGILWTGVGVYYRNYSLYKTNLGLYHRWENSYGKKKNS